MAVEAILLGLLQIVFGLFVIGFPKMLRYLIGAYFIIVGAIAVLLALA